MDEKKAEIWGKKIFSYGNLLFVNKSNRIKSKTVFENKLLYEVRFCEKSGFF